LQCGLLKVIEWSAKPYYEASGGRRWIQYAPSCPPDADPLAPSRAKAAAAAKKAAERERRNALLKR